MAGVVALILLAGLAAVVATAAWPLQAFDWPLGIISLSAEQNIPTWYSSHLIVLCAVMLMLVSLSEHEHAVAYRRRWRGLACAFVYLSVDEAIELHEGLNLFYQGTGVLHYAWIVPFGVIVIALGAIYWKFLAALPEVTRRRFIIAGALYVGGALGIEMILGAWTEVNGEDNFTYMMIDWVEESFEICGMTLFAWALGSFLASSGQGIKIIPIRSK